MERKKAFIEYAWDITELRRSQKIFESQIETLIRSVPNAEGIFHLDVTADRCINISGRSDNARTIYSESLSIDDAAENARILKLEGYVTTGLDKQSTKSFPYYETCR